MKPLATIRQDDIEPGFIMPVEAMWSHRHAARAVLRDTDGKIALLYAAKLDYYKLPGGGVENGEDMMKTLVRELLEEVGATAKITGELGRVEEWRYLKDDNLHQISDAYAAEVIGELKEPDLTEYEIAIGFSVVWAENIDEAILLVERGLENSDIGVRFMATREAMILRAADNDMTQKLKA